MTDNEIVKALECCIADNVSCDGCPAIGVCQHDPDCPKSIALNLINRQKAEIERVTENFNCQQTVYADLSKIIKDQAEKLKTAKTKAYKECFAKVGEVITEIYNKHIFGNNDLEAEEKDAIINFSDDVTYRLDNLLKELVGEDG